MSLRRATAWAPANVGVVKHWGFRPGRDALPARSSLSLTLAHGATTTVELAPEIGSDTVVVAGRPIRPSEGEKERAAFGLLDEVRVAAGLEGFGARVSSVSDLPTSRGMASSASGGAALTVAALAAAGLLEGASEPDLLAWCARTRSVSALRSLRGGAVELRLEDDHVALGTVETPLELSVLSCLVDPLPKRVSSSLGHGAAPKSPFWREFEARAAPMLEQARTALATGDLHLLGEIAEAETRTMHAVMLTGRPPIVYATDATWAVFRAVAAWRKAGLAAYCTLDAGPNPHVICMSSEADDLARRLSALDGVLQLWQSPVGRRGATLIG